MLLILLGKLYLFKPDAKRVVILRLVFLVSEESQPELSSLYLFNQK